MKAKKRVRDNAVYIPLCMANGDGICAELVPGGYCNYSEFRFKEYRGEE